MIGIIGGYGNIGIHAAKILYKKFNNQLRLGGRNLEKAVEFKKEHRLDNIECMYVNIEDFDSICNFAKDCGIILNCAGPSHNKSAKAAAIITSLGCKYIDVGHDINFKNISSLKEDGQIIYQAGSIPGLSGILPQYLAKCFDKVSDMEFYYEALGNFTQSSAEDYLQGIFCDKDNSLETNLSNNDENKEYQSKNINGNKIKLPLSDREVSVYPFYDEECAFVSNKLNMNNARWNMAIDGDCIKKFMKQARVIYKEDRAKAIKELCTASYIDTLGRQLYARFVIQMMGYKNGEKIVKTLILISNNPSYLTGLVAASAVITAYKNITKPGIYSINQIEEVEKFIQILCENNEGISIKIHDNTIKELQEDVEGEI